jgi:hypothetical protein
LLLDEGDDLSGLGKAVALVFRKDEDANDSDVKDPALAGTENGVHLESRF